MSNVTIDTATRIIKSSSIRISAGQKKYPIDYTRDKILILDEAGRPVAMIQPLGNPPAAPAPPVVTPRRDVVAVVPLIAAEPEAPAEPSSTGRLSEQHIEQLQRLWRLNPGRQADWIATEFTRQHGRGVSERVAEKYRPTHC